MAKRVAWGRGLRNFHFARKFAVFKRDGLILENPKYYIKIPFISHSINNKHHAVNIVWKIIIFIATLHKQAVLLECKRMEYTATTVL